MSQTFEYPNLLTGSRSGAGWLYDNGGMRLERSDLNHKQHALLNSTKYENFIRSPFVSLKHGIVYEFSVYTANGSNCAGSDIFVLYEKTVDGWIARSITKCAKGPGGMDHFCIHNPRCLSGRQLLHQIRQQWLNGWERCTHLVRQPDAVHCFRTACMDSGRRGGVAVNE